MEHFTELENSSIICYTYAKCENRDFRLFIFLNDLNFAIKKLGSIISNIIAY